MYLIKKSSPLFRHGKPLFLLCLFALCLAFNTEARDRGGKPRPKSEDKLHLLHANITQFDASINPDAQILIGDVRFLHDQVYMWCDSANYYEASNSFEAFGHVRMTQGDTLSLTSDYLYYDGNTEIAQVRYDVVLKHRDSRLETDSLNYDRMYNLAYFFDGGTLYDKTARLTSDWGEYNTTTREAVFNYRVVMTDQGSVIHTDTLHYYTPTRMAHLTGPSTIDNGESHIDTDNGWYDSNSKEARLLNRSVLTNKNSRMTGDSIWFDNNRSIGESFYNVVYTDTVNKNMLTGDYCYYDDVKGYAMATNNAVAYDFSTPDDTLFVHADTLKLFTYHINTDSVERKVYGYDKVRAYRSDVQAVCDTLIFVSKDSCLNLVGNPILWNKGQQLLGEVIKVYMNDSTVDHMHVIGQALSVEQIDSLHYNQVSSREMKAFMQDGRLRESQAIGNVLIVNYPMDDDSLMIGLNYAEVKFARIFLAEGRMDRIWMSGGTGTLYPITQIPAEKQHVPNFAWFDYIRPLDKHDIFVWRGKKSGTELKKQEHREIPIQNLNKIKQKSRRPKQAPAQ